ncbi:MAG: YibE/F family protein [Brevefilum sp.]|nr:YibE/F family protein [Brevefilum sp.]
MTRKTFLWIVRGVALAILIAVLAPRVIDFFTQPAKEQTMIGYSADTVTATVDSIIEEGIITLGDVDQPYQIVAITVTDGANAGNRFAIDYGTRQIRTDMIPLGVGDKIMVTLSRLPDGSVSAHFTDFYRGRSLLFLFFTFIAFSILVSGWKGVRSIIGIGLSLVVIVIIILPGIQQGQDPLLTSILGSFFFVSYSLYIIYGWNMKTHAAVIGSLLVLVITGLLAYFFVNQTRLTGYGDENMFYISQMTQNTLNVRHLLLAGIMIGTLGVLDDLVISQSSAVFELYRNNPGQDFRKLYRSAMNIGQDHIAATVNTLVLAYAGAALPMLLLFSVGGVDYGMAINLEFIAEEVVRTLVGSLGLFASVPITTALAAMIAVKYRDFGKFKTYLGALNE